MRNRNKQYNYNLTVSKSPVLGYKCYTVFRNGDIFFTIDGDRVSVFEEEVVESFTLPDFPQYRVYRIGDMLFTGFLPLTEENMGRLPGGCEIYPA